MHKGMHRRFQANGKDQTKIIY